MGTFVASKFNADTDLDRPAIGSTFVDDGVLYVIKEVGWVLTSKLVAELINEQVDESISVMAPRNGLECMSRSHATRPGVVWLVWVDKEIVKN